MLFRFDQMQSGQIRFATLQSNKVEIEGLIKRSTHCLFQISALDCFEGKNITGFDKFSDWELIALAGTEEVINLENLLFKYYLNITIV